MRCKDVHKLLGLYLGDALPPELREELKVHFAKCGACEGRLADFLEIEARLRDSGPTGLEDPGERFNDTFWEMAGTEEEAREEAEEEAGFFGSDGGPYPAPGPRFASGRTSRKLRLARRRPGFFGRALRWTAVAAAAAAVAFVVVTRAEFRGEPERPAPAVAEEDTRPAPMLGSVELVKGRVQLADADGDLQASAGEGTRLRVGDRISTKSSRARIRFESGTALYVNENTEFSLPVPAAALELAHGEIYTETSDVDIGFYVDTPSGRFTCLGTRFGVEMRGAGANMAVVGGRVKASTDAGTVDVTSGHEVALAMRNEPPGDVREALDLNERFAWTCALGSEGPFDTRPSRELIVQLRFDERKGRATANTGSSKDYHPRAVLTSPSPRWSRNVPPGGGAGSLDWGTAAGPHAVDLRGRMNALVGLKSFTITGWLNCRRSAEGSGGNRIVSWSKVHPQTESDGVDFVFKQDGSLQVGVNEWPDLSVARSSPGMITVDARAGRRNWRFFALTYDVTARAGHLKFYFGSAESPARLDRAIDYDRGALGGRIAGSLSIGHFAFGPRSFQGNEDRMFGGLIDEIRIYGSAKDGSGALSAEEIEAARLSGSAAHEH